MSVIVSDVTNGDIIAMDSFPKYDNNNPTVPLDNNAIKEFENLDEKGSGNFREIKRSFESDVEKWMHQRHI